MHTLSYRQRRSELQTYFDRTASETWARLTSDAPVSGIRRTVRAGRDRMRATLVDWMPADLSGMRVLDAGCGTGALSFEAARRGAHVVAIDLAESLVALAAERTETLRAGLPSNCLRARANSRSTVRRTAATICSISAASEVAPLSRNRAASPIRA